MISCCEYLHLTPLKVALTLPFRPFLVRRGWVPTWPFLDVQANGFFTSSTEEVGSSTQEQSPEPRGFPSTGRSKWKMVNFLVSWCTLNRCLKLESSSLPHHVPALTLKTNLERNRVPFVLYSSVCVIWRAFWKKWQIRNQLLSTLLFLSVSLF